LRFTTDKTPFYSEAGGQPNDTGWVPHEGKNFPVQTFKGREHSLVEVGGELPALEKGSSVILAVDVERRNSLQRPHTTCHLMLGALKQVLGEHVSQAGSQLGEDEIRFDFSHFQAVTPEEMRRVEAIVNRQLIADLPVSIAEMPLTDAKAMGVTAVFDEKYGVEVRVVSIGEAEPGSLTGWVSRELCGGTHLSRTSQAGMFLIMREESVQSGVRRIYAVVGHKAFAYVQAGRQMLDWLGVHYKRPLVSPTGLTIAEMWVRDVRASLGIDKIQEGVSELATQAKKAVKKSPITQFFNLILPKTDAVATETHSHLVKQHTDFIGQVHNWCSEISGKIIEAEQKLREAHQAAAEARRELVVADKLEELQAQVVKLGGLQILSVAVELDDRGDLKYLVERFAGGVWKDSYVVFIAANVGGKAALSCKVSPDAIERGVKANDLIKLGAGICGGGGGGKPGFAEAGGKDGGKAPEAAQAVLDKMQELLS
jgi:alanyl-tRNA synthetase